MKLLAVLIDELLPQTQCQRCGYKGCAPYAQAIANNEATINLCIPGGDVTMRAIATLTKQEPTPLSQDNQPALKTIAVIDESKCIGCTICLQHCPVDAIVGAAKQMHSILTDECTGCELCISPCPMACISMQVISEPTPTWSIGIPQNQSKATNARIRFENKNKRQAVNITTNQPNENQNLKDEIQAAILRAKQKRQNLTSTFST